MYTIKVYENGIWQEKENLERVADVVLHAYAYQQELGPVKVFNGEKDVTGEFVDCVIEIVF